MDTDLTVKATDADFIAEKQSDDDTSCNQITCEVVAAEPIADPIVQCEVVQLPESGEYDVVLSLTQRIDNPDLSLGDTYTFQIVTQVILKPKIHPGFKTLLSRFHVRIKEINVRRLSMCSHLKVQK